MSGRRSRPQGLEIEFFDGASNLANEPDAQWLTSNDRDTGERPALTPATKWLIGLALVAGVGGLIVTSQNQTDDTASDPSATALPPVAAPTPSAPGGPASSDANPLATAALQSIARPILDLVRLDADSAVLAGSNGQSYRFGLTDFVLFSGPLVEPPLEPTLPLWPGEKYLGDAADGTPVVRADDGLAYLLGPDGRKTLLAAGRVDRVEFGWFAEAVCATDNECRWQLHGVSGPVDYPWHPDSRVAFAPDGSRVAIWSGTSVEVIDLTTSSPTTGDVPVFVQQPSGTTSAQPMVWRADSGSVGFVDDFSLVVIDAISGKTERMMLPVAAVEPRAAGED